LHDAVVDDRKQPFGTRPASSKILKSSTPSKDYLICNASHSQDNINSVSSLDLRISLSDSNLSEPVTTMTDTNDNRISSTISVERSKRADIAQPNEIENHLDNSGNSQGIKRSSVTVRRTNKVSDLDETNKRNSIPTQQETLSASSAIPSKSW
jgi:hypothetical protein